jgi:hypothetical protein
LKLQPLAGAALKVTGVPVAYPALHVAPQLIPEGELVTVPLPVTLTERTEPCETVSVALKIWVPRPLVVLAKMTVEGP